MEHKQIQSVSNLLPFSLKEAYESVVEIAKRCNFEAHGLDSYNPTISMKEIEDFTEYGSNGFGCKRIGTTDDSDCGADDIFTIEEAAASLSCSTFENFCYFLGIDLLKNHLYLSVSIDDACVRLNGVQIESICEFIVALLNKECNLEVLGGVLFEPFGELIKDQIQDMLNDGIITQDSPFCALLSKNVEKKDQQ